MSKALTPETKAYLKITTWTFSIIVGLAAINGFMIYSAVIPISEIPFTRNIASIDEVDEATDEYFSPVIEWDCKKAPPKNLQTKASTARVQFTNCQQVGRIINITNNNQGDVFPVPLKKEWTSDFVFLSPGINRLQIPIGDESYSIDITREKTKKLVSNKAL